MSAYKKIKIDISFSIMRRENKKTLNFFFFFFLFLQNETLANNRLVKFFSLSPSLNDKTTKTHAFKEN